MKLKLKIIGSILLVLAVLVVFWVLIRNNSFDVLQPAGVVGDKQLELIIFASVLSLIVIVPVFVMTFLIVWKYRESNKNNKSYHPEWRGSKIAEAIWWGIPFILITILGVTIWTSSHELDPYRELDSDKKPLKVQVIALDWKWLFIYPEQNIASVNYLHIPVDRPINFDITSDAPMNSFWIPKLGGQVYAMSGMNTQLHLEAHTKGDFTGKSANISGEGYSGMNFTTRVGTEADFEKWVGEIKSSGSPLTAKGYEQLAKPSQNVAPIYYSSRPTELYDTVIMKYMMPAESSYDHEGAEQQHE